MGNGRMDFHMEKVSCFTPMVATMLDTFIKEMLMERADLSVLKVGFMKANYKMSKHKEKEYFTTVDLTILIMVDGPVIYLTDLANKNGKIEELVMKDNL
jgi:hypothetical protein